MRSDGRWKSAPDTDRIELRRNERLVGAHARCFGRDQTVFDPWHCVPVLARKPGALRNGAPLKDWVLPPGLGRSRRKLAGSIRYQITISKLPLAKDIAEFQFADTPVDETLVHDLASGNFLVHQRNVVPVGGTGTGTGKTHLAIAMARAPIRHGKRGRFFNVVELVDKLEAEGGSGRQGRMAEYLCRMDFVLLDELGDLPFAHSGGQLLFHPISRLYEQTSMIVTTNLAFGEPTVHFRPWRVLSTSISFASHGVGCAPDSPASPTHLMSATKNGRCM